MEAQAEEVGDPRHHAAHKQLIPCGVLSIDDTFVSSLPL